ncbi:hypothetical protein WDV13_00855 [Weissella cibaria]|uniref:hypothetical protein n=1 Tax=Weissella cibaria TaxID=137591 RepID=UPI00211E656C|nr:hypothetical protein [Weissella cibaria]MCQ9619245.1 hypothetical protein [Weissella cibaria]
MDSVNTILGIVASILSIISIGIGVSNSTKIKNINKIKGDKNVVQNGSGNRIK